jgi:hypothetical protein
MLSTLVQVVTVKCKRDLCFLNIFYYLWGLVFDDDGNVGVVSVRSNIWGSSVFSSVPVSYRVDLGVSRIQTWRSCSTERTLRRSSRT